MVQGHQQRGREGHQVSEWDRWRFEKQTLFQKRHHCGNYAEGWDTEEIPAEGHEGIVSTFALSEVNTRLLSPAELFSWSLFFLLISFLQLKLRDCRLWGLLSDCQIPGLNEAVCTELRYLFITGMTFSIFFRMIYFNTCDGVHSVSIYSCLLLCRFWECWVKVPSLSELKPWSVCLKWSLWIPASWQGYSLPFTFSLLTTISKTSRSVTSVITRSAVLRWICSVGFMVASWTIPPVCEKQPWSLWAVLFSADQSSLSSIMTCSLKGYW